MRERETPKLMKKEHTNILFLSRVFCIVLAFQFASKTQKEAAHGGGAQLNEKMKKDMKIMFLSLVSHFVCFALQFALKTQKMAVALPQAIKTFKFLA